MRRRDLLLAAFAQTDDFGLRLWNHLKHVQELAIAYYGCAPDASAITDEQCRPHRARLDRRKYEQSRESARKLFDL